MKTTMIAYFNREAASRYMGEFRNDKPGVLTRGTLIHSGIGIINIKESFQFCVECNTEWPWVYMMKDEVWAEAGFADKSIYCFDCFKKAIGRELFYEDFDPDAKCNSIILKFASHRPKAGD